MIVRSEDLHKTFRRHEALHGVSLQVPEGGVYALIGPNGAGKTTLIKALLNILLPTRGRSEVLGVDSRRLSPGELAQIGYVSENQELPARLPVGVYLEYLRRFYARWDRAFERRLMDEFQLPADQRIGDLSHGVRMKVRLTSSLCYRPKLLVMDEPFSGLDPLVRDELLGTVRSQGQDMTVLLSSHELDEIEASTTHVGYLEEGRLLFQESMSALAARVREVRITLAEPARAPADVPANWLDLQVNANLVSFVDIGFSQEALTAAAQSRFPGIRDLQVEPVALRSIFTSLARSRRQRGAMT